MSSNQQILAFRILWWTLGIGILVLSIQTVIGAHSGEHHADLHAIVIGSLEAISAVLFLIPGTMRIGALGLLFTIVVAFTMHAFMHHFRWDLLIYGAAVHFVKVHGVPHATGQPTA